MNIPDFSTVSISIAAGASKELMAAATGKTARIHALHVATDSTGGDTVKIGTYSTAAGSTNETLISGAMTVGASGQINFPFVPTTEGVLAGAAARNLRIYSTGAAMAGYAVVSSSTY